MNRAPNILLIVSDQQRADLLGCAGRYGVKTPRLDQMAREGTRFTRAYTPCPLCTPARASLLSGQYPSRHGAWSIGVDTPEETLSLAHLLGQAGYATGLLGKSHLRTCLAEGQSPEALPFTQDWEHFRRWTGPWYGFDHAKICNGHGPESHAYCMHYGLHLRDHGIPPEPPYFARLEDPHPNGRWGRWALPEELHTSTWVADETIAFLQQTREEAPDRPFFASVNFPDPHLPFQVPEPWHRLHDDVALPQPLRVKNEAQGKPTLYQACVEGRLHALGWHDEFSPPCQYAEQVESCAWTPEEEAKWRVYMGMQSLVDKNVGRLLGYLEQEGLCEDTLVIYTSDHGDYMGDHWLWSKGGSHYDGAVRVPFLVRWPGRVPAGVTSEAMQSLVDLAPSLLSLASQEPNPQMQGANQLEVWTGKTSQVREGVLIEHFVEEGLTVNSWITPDYRLSHHAIHAEERDEWELYDLAEDPGEMKNLAAEEFLGPIQLDLLGQMQRYQAAMHKPGGKRLAFA